MDTDVYAQERALALANYDIQVKVERDLVLLKLDEILSILKANKPEDEPKK